LVALFTVSRCQISGCHVFRGYIDVAFFYAAFFRCPIFPLPNFPWPIFPVAQFSVAPFQLPFSVAVFTVNHFISFNCLVILPFGVVSYACLFSSRYLIRTPSLIKETSMQRTCAAPPVVGIVTDALTMRLADCVVTM